MTGLRSFSAFLLLVFAANDGSAVTIQALVDLDNDSEDLVKSLINTVDALVDPKVIDSKNATQELALALLKLGPLITVSGNITDGTQGFTLSFSFNAKADVNNSLQPVVETSCSNKKNEEYDPDRSLKAKGGVFQPITTFLEPYVIGAATIICNGVVANIIAHFMNELSLLSNINMT